MSYQVYLQITKISTGYLSVHLSLVVGNESSCLIRREKVHLLLCYLRKVDSSLQDCIALLFLNHLLIYNHHYILSLLLVEDEE